MTTAGARNVSLDKLDNCLANAIYKAIDDAGGSLEPGKVMVVTYDVEAGVTRAAVYKTAFDVLTQEFPGHLSDPAVDAGIKTLKESLDQDLDVKYVDCDDVK